MIFVSIQLGIIIPIVFFFREVETSNLMYLVKKQMLLWIVIDSLSTKRRFEECARDLSESYIEPLYFVNLCLMHSFRCPRHGSFVEKVD